LNHDVKLKIYLSEKVINLLKNDALEEAVTCALPYGEDSVSYVIEKMNEIRFEN